VLVRIGQEVQALPRRVSLPERLVGTSICLDPITSDDAGDLDWLAREDDVRRFTRVPSDPQPGFGEAWAARYVLGWQDGDRAGFAIRSLDGEFLGLAGFVELDRGAKEGELGYVVAAEARGRGVATQAVGLLTRWGFDELGLERITLVIDRANLASEKVAERCGYVREGTLRSAHVKDDIRADTGLWSRLRSD
jgi:RimJ/RimL family protein N-acetyltransferase